MKIDNCWGCGVLFATLEDWGRWNMSGRCGELGTLGLLAIKWTEGKRPYEWVDKQRK